VLLRPRRQRPRSRAAEQRDERAAFLDHLVGAGEQRGRNFKTESLRDATRLPLDWNEQRQRLAFCIGPLTLRAGADILRLSLN
jgi:hypothetical protein